LIEVLKDRSNASYQLNAITLNGLKAVQYPKINRKMTPLISNLYAKEINSQRYVRNQLVL